MHGPLYLKSRLKFINNGWWILKSQNAFGINMKKLPSFPSAAEELRHLPLNSILFRLK